MLVPAFFSVLRVFRWTPRPSRGTAGARSLNYRHAFHVGNFGDVLKHSVLVSVLGHMQRKDKPMMLLDTHSSRGMFELTSQEATRSPEHLQGIGKLMAWVESADRRGEDIPDACQNYLECVRRVNEPGKPLQYYPGSPTLFYMHTRSIGKRFRSDQT